MNRRIKLTYANHYNAGDLLNKRLVEKLADRPVVRTRLFCADMMAIGGAIFALQYSSNVLRRITQRILSFFFGNKPVYIWGSGFLYNRNNNHRTLYRRNLKVCALRGEKSRSKLSGITGMTYDVPLADAGLLVDMFLEDMPEKKYGIGLVLHMTQVNESSFKALKDRPDILFIDIRRSPQDVVRDIASCRTIASSSLHGLVFADSLHIPSLHIEGETPLLGGNFKFEDYYSSYGLEDVCWNIKEQGFPTVKDIEKRYRISASLVDKKKKQLVECFPNFQ